MVDFSGWGIVRSGNKRKAVDDSPVLMRRPDGQPCEVQAQYVKYYTDVKGFERVDDPLDFPDEIPATPPKKMSKAEMRKIRDEQRERMRELAPKDTDKAADIKLWLIDRGVKVPDGASKSDMLELVEEWVKKQTISKS